MQHKRPSLHPSDKVEMRWRPSGIWILKSTSSSACPDMYEFNDERIFPLLRVFDLRLSVLPDIIIHLFRLILPRKILTHYPILRNLCSWATILV